MTHSEIPAPQTTPPGHCDTAGLQPPFVSPSWLHTALMLGVAAAIFVIVELMFLPVLSGLLGCAL